MNRLLLVELKKLTKYRPFKVLMGLYLFILVFVPVGILEMLKWMKRNIPTTDFGNIDPLMLPVFHFPDVWQNLTYVSLMSKILLGIIVVISVTNDYNFKTIRQNIIDGMDRLDFLKSKLYMVLTLTLSSGLVVFLVSFISALIYSPQYEWADVFTNMEFLLGYCLELFAYLVIALFLSFLIKRSGFTIALLIVIRPLEEILIAVLPNSWDAINDYFPQRATTKIITSPFPKYIFREIQDYIDGYWVLVLLIYSALFIYLTYLSLKKSDV